MTYKGVIFDFNGTLFWDTKLHNHAWDIFLEKHRILISDHEKNLRIHGKNNQDILKSLFNDSLSSDAIAVYIHEKEYIYQEICLAQTMSLAPGVIDFLDFLKENNVKFTIATASGIENLKFSFEHLNLSKWFDGKLVVYNDGSIKSKPDPEIFQIAMRKISCKPGEVIVFEDSFSGIEAAQNANAGKVIIVNSNNEDYHRWDYFVIKDFNEVDRDLFII
jgi:beta-phosphoglucomutase